MSADLIIAAILGIVEGLTEFIPVSSTGHLILLGDAIGFTGPKAETFDVFIQLGAILAVVVLYRERFLDLIRFSKSDLGTPEGFSGVEGLLKMAVACIPAFILGALFHKTIKEHLFNSVTVAAALIVGGAVMLFIERVFKDHRTDSIEKLTLQQCFWIGVIQCFSLWPGMSRSGSSIVGGIMVGCSRRAAAEFSFLIAVPVMFAAVGYDMLKSYKLLAFADLPLFGIGFLVSFLVSIVAIKFFLELLRRFSLVPFGVYRIVLGIFVLWRL